MRENSNLQFYCPACREYSQINKFFILWPGNENIECPECHTSFIVNIEFSEVSSLQTPEEITEINTEDER